jgi:hypothetical protein
MNSPFNNDPGIKRALAQQELLQNVYISFN